VPVIEGDTYNLIAAADLALVSSGTATLECALLECPMVIVYRVSRLTAFLARLLVRGVRHIGMPNIVAGHEVVPELLQGRATGPGIAAEARAILDSPARRAALAVLRGGLDFGSEYLTDWIGQRVVTDLRNELTVHMQRLDLAFFNRQRAGQIVSRVTTDVSLVRGTVTDALTSLFEDITRLIGL